MSKSKIAELFKPGGRGIIATASASGAVNTAIYAKPHIIDEEIVAWGMTDGRTYGNIKENPNASYLYMNSDKNFSGIRLNLKLKEVKDSGDLLDLIKHRTAEIVNSHAAEAVKHVAYFEILEKRPLI